MERLDARDLAHVGQFVAEAGEIEGDEPFPPAFLAVLQRLVPCEEVTFSELDRIAQVELGLTRFPEADLHDVPEIRYWAIRQEHPICWHHEVTRDWRAYRLTDFVTRRQLRRSRIYAEWFRPAGVEHELAFGLDSPLTHTKVFIFDRPGGPDFDERDRVVLDVLRPYLAMRYRAARGVRETPEEAGTGFDLTPREREVLALVAEGQTNAQIAERLWISAGTVRRHLENAYAKLGVHTRTAAVRAASRRTIRSVGS
jgi:DNA-binding CsgD family transcriptional regulator